MLPREATFIHIGPAISTEAVPVSETLKAFYREQRRKDLQMVMFLVMTS
jgi:hypothetical protein